MQRSHALLAACLWAASGTHLIAGQESGAAHPGKAALGNDCRSTPVRNLLRNPEMQLAPNARRPKPWSSAQHAGEPSFKVSYEGNAVVIRKTGTQPWFTFSQKVDASEAAGKTIELSAELKLDLTPGDWPSPEQTGGGLQIVVWGRGIAMGGPRLLLESTLQHEPKLGRTEWTPVSVTLRLPEDAVSVKAGFLHQANGTMAVRNPVLRIVEDGCAAAAPSSP